jgi:hypothetical protein
MPIDEEMKEVSVMAFSNNEDKLAIGLPTGYIHVYSIETRQRMGVLEVNSRD